jgi:hypothetical protein
VTQVDVIKMIGDVLTEIDMAVGSLLPDDPDLLRLQDVRRLLDARQLALSRQVFDDNTARFQEAANRLKSVNDEIRGTIRRIGNMTTVIENVTKFLGAVTSFIGTVGGFA